MRILPLSRMAFSAAALVIAAGVPAYAGTLIKVDLWDQGSEAEMRTDLGMDMAGNPSMANMGLKLSTTAAKAGKVTFKVANDSKELVHEMVIFPLPDGEKIPYDGAEAKINEDAAGHLGEVSELNPDQTGAVTLDLKPGRYIVACNIPNHYANGMWAVVTVTK